MHPSALFHDACRVGIDESDSDESDISLNSDEIEQWNDVVSRTFEGNMGSENDRFRHVTERSASRVQRRLEFDDEEVVVSDSAPRSAFIANIHRIINI